MISEKQQKKRPRGKPFAKGDARINRTGRPKDFPAFQELIREMGEEMGVKGLLELAAGFTTLREAQDGEPAVRAPIKENTRLAAIELLLAYARGRPVQAHEVTGKDGKDLIPVLDEDGLLERLKRLEKTVAPPASPG